MWRVSTDLCARCQRRDCYEIGNVRRNFRGQEESNSKEGSPQEDREEEGCCEEEVIGRGETPDLATTSKRRPVQSAASSISQTPHFFLLFFSTLRAFNATVGRLSRAVSPNDPPNSRRTALAATLRAPG